jgi:prolyl 4-hydroxylase
MALHKIDRGLPLWHVEALFSKERCDALIRRADSTATSAHGVERDRAWHAGNGTKNSRVVVWDRKLATELWDRLGKQLPKIVEGYELKYINPCFRYSRYEPGGYIGVHVDGHNYDHPADGGEDTVNVLTLNIFLNSGDFDGGETLFFEHVPPPKKGPLRLCASPVAGNAALFHRGNLHCGSRVQRGRKYLLRTDVMGVCTTR